MKSIVGKRLPDYYPTMYLDGYTPEEILQAQHQTMIKKYTERKLSQTANEDEEIALTIEVKKK